MLKHLLLFSLLLSLAAWDGLAAIAGDDLPDRTQERIKELAEKKSHMASYDVSKVANVASLTPTQSARLLLAPDAHLRVRWALPLKGTTVKRICVPPQDTELKYVLVETAQNDLIAVRADNGMPLWWVKYPEPIVGDVFFGNYNVHFVSGNRLVALERMSGDLQWNVALPFAPVSGPAAHEPTKDSSYVFISAMNRKAYCLDVVQEEWPPKGQNTLPNSTFAITLASPRILWQYMMAGISRHTPLYDAADNYLYLGSLNKRLYGLRLEDAITRGSPLDEGVWEYHTMGDTVAAPIAEGPHVIFPSLDQYLYCLTGNEGAVIWKYAAALPLSQTPQLLLDSENKNECLQIVQRVGANTLVGIDNSRGNALWQHDKGMMIVGVSSTGNSKREKQMLAISYDSDHHLSAILPLAKDVRTDKEKRDDDMNQRHMAAKVAWRLAVDKLANFAPNNYGSYIFCTTADAGTLCALERNK
ncbi:MAG: PQQ-binding-like beta-propeller repeat protein [Planctomycetes bacterium]|nr:PQQ-binding-like beta-propeller repeat protein [Planctomycetota bacterium]